jgi:alpha-beta hydrolase superfamily lysophospholipase
VPTFQDPFGVEVAYRQWDRPDPTGVVVISHGASEHSGRYERFAAALNGAGFAALAVDHRGHGGTATATGAGKVGLGGGHALITDLDHLVGFAQQCYPVAPVALFGHSMGSMLALAYATAHADKLAGLALSGFAAAPGTMAEFGQQLAQAVAAGMADQPAPSLSGLNEAFEPGRTPYDWLSRDAAEVDRYIADPLCGDDLPLTFGFMSELFAIVAPALEAAPLAAISCPVLLITGAQDPAAAMGENAHLLDAALQAGGVKTTSHLYPEARHELLNEINRDEVTRDVVSWLIDRCGRAAREDREASHAT